jgi:hypothetical protein
VVQEHKEELSDLEKRIEHLEKLESKVCVLSKFNELPPKMNKPNPNSPVQSESSESINRSEHTFFSHKRSYSLNDLSTLDEGVYEGHSNGMRLTGSNA